MLTRSGMGRERPKRSTEDEESEKQKENPLYQEDQWRFYDEANGSLAPPPPPPSSESSPSFKLNTRQFAPLPFGAPQNTGAEPLQFDKSKTANVCCVFLEDTTKLMQSPPSGSSK